MIDEYLIDENTAQALARDHGRRRSRGLRHRHFLRGPVPMWWIQRAMVLPGMGLAAAIMIWFRAGVTGSKSVALNLSSIGFDRTSAARGLRALERAGLVSVVRRRGRRPVVSILGAIR
jgi:hypothetical protein